MLLINGKRVIKSITFIVWVNIIQWSVKVDNIKAVETYWWWIECSAFSKVYLHNGLLVKANGPAKPSLISSKFYFLN